MSLELGSLIVASGVIIFSLVYVYTMGRRGASKANKDSNDILRGLINDQKQEILKIRERLHIAENLLTALKVRGEYLEKLVNVALLEYFNQFPDSAKSAKDLIEKNKEN